MSDPFILSQYKTTFTKSFTYTPDVVAFSDLPKIINVISNAIEMRQAAISAGYFVDIQVWTNVTQYDIVTPVGILDAVENFQTAIREFVGAESLQNTILDQYGKLSTIVGSEIAEVACGFFFDIDGEYYTSLSDILPSTNGVFSPLPSIENYLRLVDFVDAITPNINEIINALNYLRFLHGRLLFSYEADSKCAPNIDIGVLCNGLPICDDPNANNRFECGDCTYDGSTGPGGDCTAGLCTDRFAGNNGGCAPCDYVNCGNRGRCLDALARNHNKCGTCEYDDDCLVQCRDSRARNYNQCGQCIYGENCVGCNDGCRRCSNINANNFGDCEPCTFDGDGPVDPKCRICRDAGAINVGGCLPCRYPPVCNEVDACNFGRAEFCDCCPQSPLRFCCCDQRAENYQRNLRNMICQPGQIYTGPGAGSARCNYTYECDTPVSIVGVCRFRTCCCTKTARNYDSTCANPRGICDPEICVFESLPGEVIEIGCFAHGTKITMADNTQKNIEDLQEGDYVLAYYVQNVSNLDLRGEKLRQFVGENTNGNYFAGGKIKKVIRSYDNSYIMINDRIKVTAEHPFYVKNDNKYFFVRADNLNTDYMLINEMLQEEKVYNIAQVEQRIDTVNFQVDFFETFIADGFIVHNRGDDKTTSPIIGGPDSSLGNFSSTISTVDEI